MAKKGKRYALRDVRAALRQKKYGLARQYFVNAKIKKGQEQEAETLKKSVFCGQAYQYFKECNYKKCILFIEDIENESPTPLDSLLLIKGLSHLFLANYSIADSLLGTVTQKTEFSSFRFYYLLNLVFQNKNQPEIDLPGAENLPKNRQEFLKIAQAFCNGEFLNAMTMLETLQTESRAELQNKNALLALLQNKSIDSNEAQNRKIRPLYKAMLNLALAPDEIEYLSEFPQLTEKYTLSSTSKIVVAPELILEPIRRLCEKGIPLTPKEFALCRNAPEPILPLILYNHIAALFNEDPEESSEEIFKIISSNYSLLCQVPEFPFLCNAVYRELPREFDIKNSVIRGIVNTFIDNFGDKLAADKAAQVSWKLSEIAFSMSVGAAPDKFASFSGNIYREYPAMKAFGWDCFTNYFKAVSPSVNWSYLTLFNEPIDDLSKKEILVDFREMLKMMGFSSMMIPPELMDLIDDPDLLYKEMFKQVLNIFDALLIKQPPLKSDKFLLEILAAFGETLRDDSAQKGKVSPALLNQFKEVNNNYLNYFESTEDSEFRKKHEEIIGEAEVALEEFTAFFDSKNAYQKAKNDRKDPVKALKIESLRLVNLIDRYHFDEEAMDLTEDFLSYAYMAVAEYGEDKENVLPVIRNFAVQYAVMTNDIQCEHPVDFFYEMVEIILAANPQGELNLLMAEALFKADNFVFENDELEPRHIRLLEDFCEKYEELTSKKQPVGVDLDFIKKIGKELEKIGV